jgi:hypothetical protein
MPVAAKPFLHARCHLLLAPHVSDLKILCVSRALASRPWGANFDQSVPPSCAMGRINKPARTRGPPGALLRVGVSLMCVRSNESVCPGAFHIWINPVNRFKLSVLPKKCTSRKNVPAYTGIQT